MVQTNSLRVFSVLGGQKQSARAAEMSVALQRVRAILHRTAATNHTLWHRTLQTPSTSATKRQALARTCLGGGGGGGGGVMESNPRHVTET